MNSTHFISLFKTKINMSSNNQLSKYLFSRSLSKNCMQFKKFTSNNSYSTWPVLRKHDNIQMNLCIKYRQSDFYRISSQRLMKYTCDLQDFQYFCTEDNPRQKTFQKVFIEKKDKFNENKQHFINDIKQKRIKMKEKMEAIIERENVLTIPNLLCVSRIIACPFLGYLIVQTDFDWALGLLAIAGITDVLDGYIARCFVGQASKIGSFLDPMADKMLIATLFLTLTYIDLIPIFLTGLIICRDVVLVSAGFYIRYISLPPPRTFSRYFDVTHATVSLAPTNISKVNTFVQLALVASTMATQMGNWLPHTYLPYLWYMTAATTLASGVSYLLARNTIKFLKDIKSKKSP